MNVRFEIRAGVAISIASFLWLLLEYYMGFHSKYIDYYPFITWLSVIIPIVGLYWAMKARRDGLYAGKIHFGQALLCGLFITAVMSVIIPLLSWLYVSVINPLFFPAMRTHRQEMIEGLNLSSPLDKEELLRETFREYTVSSYIVRSFVMTLISGVILSLIIAGVIKKDNRFPEEESLSDPPAS